MLPPRTSRSVLLLAIVAALAGCTPTCEDVCEKLVACENPGTERMSAPECEEECNAQQELYARWSDTQLRASFDEQLTCLYDAECADVAAGACYDDEVFTF